MTLFRNLSLLSMAATLSVNLAYAANKPKPVSPKAAQNLLERALKATSALERTSKRDNFGSAESDLSSLKNILTSLLKKDCPGDAELEAALADIPNLQTELRAKTVAKSTRAEEGISGASDLTAAVVSSPCWETYNPSGLFFLEEASWENSNVNDVIPDTLEVPVNLGDTPMQSIFIQNRGNSDFQFESIVVLYADGSSQEIDGAQLSTSGKHSRSTFNFPAGVVSSIIFNRALIGYDYGVIGDYTDSDGNEQVEYGDDSYFDIEINGFTAP